MLSVFLECSFRAREMKSAGGEGDAMLLSALFWFALAVPLGQALEFRYHNTTEVEQYLKEISHNYSSITHLHSIGQSVEGKFSLLSSSAVSGKEGIHPGL